MYTKTNEVYKLCLFAGPFDMQYHLGRFLRQKHNYTGQIHVYMSPNNDLWLKFEPTDDDQNLFDFSNDQPVTYDRLQSILLILEMIDVSVTIEPYWQCDFEYSSDYDKNFCEIWWMTDRDFEPNKNAIMGL